MLFIRRKGYFSSPRQLDEAFEFADAGGVTHFAEGFGFDLADALAGDLELAADFFEGAAVAVLEAEALFEDFAFALSRFIILKRKMSTLVERRRTGRVRWHAGRS